MLLFLKCNLNTSTVSHLCQMFVGGLKKEPWSLQDVPGCVPDGSRGQTAGPFAPPGAPWRPQGANHQSPGGWLDSGPAVRGSFGVS